MRRQSAVLILLALAWSAAAAPASTALPGPAQAPARPPASPAAPATPEPPPTPESLGAPFYPSMEFLESFDAGSGQRYYLFGVDSPFGDVVAWYKNALKQKGELIFEEPPVHQFDVSKFREETMAFPPSVTVKDYTWAGSAGYPNPKAGAEPARFKTIVQIVPVPTIAPPVKK